MGERGLFFGVGGLWWVCLIDLLGVADFYGFWVGRPRWGARPSSVRLSPGGESLGAIRASGAGFA